MTPGRVARIRVNPVDCLGVCDVLDKLGLTSERFSFDQAVRIALSSLLESARQHGAIPTRAGFEFNEMMARFQQRTSADQVSRLEVARLLSGQGSDAPPIQPLSRDHLRERRRIRYKELVFRHQQDPTNFTHAELEELVPLINEFQQETI